MLCSQSVKYNNFTNITHREILLQEYRKAIKKNRQEHKGSGRTRKKIRFRNQYFYYNFQVLFFYQKIIRQLSVKTANSCLLQPRGKSQLSKHIYLVDKHTALMPNLEGSNIFKKASQKVLLYTLQVSKPFVYYC